MLRPPTAADAEAVLELVLARDVADVGAPDFSLEDLHADWAAPGVVLEHDARVAAGRDGALRGYAILLGDDAHVAVHPDAEGEGLGTLLRRWAEARAAERGIAVVRQFAHGSNDRARRLLGAAGYAPAQHYFRLRADLGELPPAPAAALRRLETPADDAAVHALVEQAFAEIEGNDPQSLEAWRAKRIGKPSFDPALCLLLEDVASRARGRGHGRALLLGVFDAFRRAGLRYAELSVHGRNRGALRLYEAVGMRPTWEAERWEKTL